MANVEVFFDEDAMKPVMSQFDYLPRIGELLAVDGDGYFQHFKVVEIWHRLDEAGERYQTCIRVEIDD